VINCVQEDFFNAILSGKERAIIRKCVKRGANVIDLSHDGHTLAASKEGYVERCCQNAC
jgi:hypothetical protein